MENTNEIYFEECCFIESASQFFDFDKIIKDNYLIENQFDCSCPLVLDEKYQKNPYLFIEYFFSIDGLAGHKKHLHKWFKTALAEKKNISKAKDFLFFHNMFTQLLNVGFIIISKQVHYSPEKTYTSNTETFGQWLIRIQNNSISSRNYSVNDFEVSSLSAKEKDNPYLFLQKALTINKVKKIRYGMLEWLEAVLSKGNSIEDLESIYLFSQYEFMTKFLEATYLIISKDKITSLIN